MSLLHKDYIDILNFYNIDGVNMTKKDVKLLAEDYLANKLCRCIKKVNPKKKNEIDFTKPYTLNTIYK